MSIDVHVVTSFSEADFMDTVYGAFSPIEMNVSALAQGQAQFKDPNIIWTENNYKNYKGIQRNIAFLGTITLTSEDGGSPAMSFTISGLPAKVRRMQTGAFYGLMFHYSSTKNEDATADIIADADIKFTEIPSENRLPYLW